MEAKLVALAPAEIVNTEFNLQLPVTIGRGRDAKIKLVHGQISRLHCEVYDDGGKLKARDLGSLNGTFVDGERISDTELKPGGILNIGSVTFRAVYGAMPPETDDSAVEFGAPRITDTVSTTSTVMEDAFQAFGDTADSEPVEAADEMDLGMFDFTEEPAPPSAAAPAPPPMSAPPAPVVPPAAPPAPAFAAYEEATISIPAPAKVAPATATPAKAPAAPAVPAPPAAATPAAPAKAAEADVDDWLSMAESAGDEHAEHKADDEDIESFFK